MVDSGSPVGASVQELLAEAVQAVGGSQRPGQQAMAEAITAAIASDENLVVQAGTGTGKSLGYLVPLARHAMATGKPVVVSTATLALQNQLINTELPRLSQALVPRLGRPLRHALVKGRSNYLCVYKHSGGYPDEPDVLFEISDGQPHPPAPAHSRLGQEMLRLRDWAATTKTGDRDELDPGVSQRAWRQVSVSAQECLGQKCPMVADCFCEKARAQAGLADVTVTNHALLAIDTFDELGILPEYQALVVDEAHELVDRVSSAVSVQLSPTMIAAAATRAGRNGGDALRAAGEQLAAQLEQTQPRRHPEQWPQQLTTALEAVRDSARDALAQLRAHAREQSHGQAGADAATQQAQASVQEVHDVAARLAQHRDQDVLWHSRIETPSGIRHSVDAAPLSVAPALAQRLFAGSAPVILTSATLTVGGSFEATTRQLGLPLAAQDRAWNSVDVGSPFDYPRQSILYIARHLPTPGRDGLAQATLEELAELIRAAGGRTLGLFSSKRAAVQAAAAMREQLDVPVLCQGEDATPNLVRRFRDDEPTCLFGTLSLWQGVDVPGPACSLVVIDRLPFPRPDDPLLAARAEAVTNHGGNGFLSVSAHYAALRLAQGAGRLIRRDTDRGVVAVLDPRLATARYGSFIASSLPPMWRCTDKPTVLAALQRLASG